MEKSRAIKILKPLANSFVDYANITMKEEDDDTAKALEMAIDALKAQLSKEGTTSDMISMTETVEHLRRVLDATVPITDYDEGYVDGVDFGISTVSTMPTIQPVATDTNVGDTISRQVAIDEIKSVYEWHDTVTMERLIEHFNNLQPKPQWIPCSEKMPEDLVEVNVTWVNRNPESYYEPIKDKPFTTTAVYYKGEWYWLSATCVDYLAEYGRCDWNKVDKAIEIIAWMPLPEAYNPNNK